MNAPRVPRARPVVWPLLLQLSGRVLGMGLVLVILAVCGALAGCGGGEADDGDDAADARVPHVNCSARPEACR